MILIINKNDHKIYFLWTKAGLSPPTVHTVPIKADSPKIIKGILIEGVGSSEQMHDWCS